MTRRSSFNRLLLTLLSSWTMAAAASAAPLYRQDFPSDKGDALSEIGWDDSHNGGNGNTSGVSKNEAGGQYLWWYNASGLVPATTTTGICFTGKMTPVPASTPGLVFAWEHRLENQKDDNDTDVTGTPAELRLAVEVGGKWYASAQAYPTTPAGVGNAGHWEAQKLAFDPAAKNWREVTLNDSGAQLGATPASDLSGDLAGIGFVATFAQHQTVNLHFLEIDAAEAAAEQKMK